MDRSAVQNLVVSQHALRRCQQRGTRAEDVQVAFKVRPVWDRGDVVYQVTDRLLLRLGLAREADRLRGLTVVVSREGVVRRVKWDCSLLAPTARGFKDEVQHKWPARDPPRAENA